ncbi:hypothetical protein, partial [Vibrio cholerae]|uniref:hypothetical protein n=1 Tax=Vibrio cholerae TaxID=666 RepID=UPI001C116214
RQDLHNLAQLQCNNSGPDAAAAARLEAFARLAMPAPTGAAESAKMPALPVVVMSGEKRASVSRCYSRQTRIA